MNTLCLATSLTLYILGFIPMYMTVKLYEQENDSLSIGGLMMAIGAWPFACAVVIVAYIIMKARGE